MYSLCYDPDSQILNQIVTLGSDARFPLAES